MTTCPSVCCCVLCTCCHCHFCASLKRSSVIPNLAMPCKQHPCYVWLVHTRSSTCCMLKSTSPLQTSSGALCVLKGQA